MLRFEPALERRTVKLSVKLQARDPRRWKRSWLSTRKFRGRAHAYILSQRSDMSFSIPQVADF